jgi:hypothetical protein
MDHLVLEHLVTLNRSVETAIDALKKLAEYPELQDEGFVARQYYLRENLADANVSILEALHESEETVCGTAYMERRAYEKKIRDPDDCYLEVMHREKERQAQGLPSRIGIHVGPDRPVAETIRGNTDSDSETDDDEESASAPEGEERRLRIIARVDALRTERMMTHAEVDKRIGLSASESWRAFSCPEGNKGWKHATPQMFEKLARAFGIDTNKEFLEFMR